MRGEAAPFFILTLLSSKRIKPIKAMQYFLHTMALLLIRYVLGVKQRHPLLRTSTALFHQELFRGVGSAESRVLYKSQEHIELPYNFVKNSAVLAA